MDARRDGQKGQIGSQGDRYQVTLRRSLFSIHVTGSSLPLERGTLLSSFPDLLNYRRVEGTGFSCLQSFVRYGRSDPPTPSPSTTTEVVSVGTTRPRSPYPSSDSVAAFFSKETSRFFPLIKTSVFPFWNPVKGEGGPGILVAPVGEV